MRLRIQLIAFAVLLALAMTPALSRAQDSGIKVEVSGFRNNNGLLRCSLWSGPDGFPRDDSHIWKHASGPVKNSSGECVFGGNIPAGDYAVTLFHDEDSSGKFKSNFDRLPARGLRIFEQRQSAVQSARLRRVQVSLRRQRLEADSGNDDIQMMKAVIVEKPGDENALKIGEVPEPAIKPDEILIRVHAAGVNRADLLQRQGFYPPPPGASEIIGMEVAGEVAAVGARCTRVENRRSRDGPDTGRRLRREGGRALRFRDEDSRRVEFRGSGRHPRSLPDGLS